MIKAFKKKNMFNAADDSLDYGKTALTERKWKNKDGKELVVFSGNIHVGNGLYIELSITENSINNGVITWEDKKGNDKAGIFINCKKWAGEKPNENKGGKGWKKRRK